jgi:hypothetical protein
MGEAYINRTPEIPKVELKKMKTPTVSSVNSEYYIAEAESYFSFVPSLILTFGAWYSNKKYYIFINIDVLYNTSSTRSGVIAIIGNEAFYENSSSSRTTGRYNVSSKYINEDSILYSIGFA